MIKLTFCNFLVAISIVGSLSSCKKEEIQPTNESEFLALSSTNERSDKIHKTNVLENHLASNSSKSWLYVKQINNGVDVTPFVPSCNLDNIITFAADGGFIEVEGASKCNPALPDVHDTGYWYIENGILSVRSQFLNNDIKILELTPHTLKVQFEYEGVGLVEFWFKAAKNNPKKLM